MTSALMYGFNELGNGKTLGITTDATQNALSTMYESMKPDVTQMQGLIDDYREVGKQFRKALWIHLMMLLSWSSCWRYVCNMAEIC